MIGAAGFLFDKNLRLRILSALILLPLAIAAIWAGGTVAIVVTMAAAMAMYFEWARLMHSSRRFLFWMSQLVIVTAAILLALQAYEFAALFLVVLTLTIGSMHLIARNIDSWRAVGALYCVGFLISLILLRQSPQVGFEATLFVAVIVWATDSFAYFFGVTIGGAKLAPSISPKKTWAGFCGGVFSGALAGMLTAYLLHLQSWMFLGLIALLIAVSSQGGDLFESWIKRKFNIKDSGNLIPGHGGLLDRLDGFVAASVMAYLIGAARAGLAMPAAGLLTW